MTYFICEMPLHQLQGIDVIIVDTFFVFVALAAIISYYGKSKEIGLINSFFVSIFLTPVAGIIIVGISRKLIKCNNCGNMYRREHDFCPKCAKNQEGFTKEELIEINQTAASEEI